MKKKLRRKSPKHAEIRVALIYQVYIQVKHGCTVQSHARSESVSMSYTPEGSAFHFEN